MSWLKNLIELKEKTGKNYRQIAEGTHQPERTIIRIFKGETDNPTITTLIPIIGYLGGNLSEIFADTCAIVGNKNLQTLQEDNEKLKSQNELLIADNMLLKSEITALTARLELTETKLLYTEKLLAVYKQYNI